jgi:hypothetical protein
MKAVTAATLAVGLLCSPLWPPLWAQSTNTVDDTTLRAAIDRELEGVPRDGELDVRVNDDGSATVTYIRPDGVTLERSVPLPERADDAVELVALLAGNLVRDQTGEVLADLTLPAPPPRRARRAPVSIGIFPPISTDIAYGEPVNANLELNAVVGVAPGVRGLALAGAIDIQRELAAGVQLAGVAALAMKDLDGVQGGGAASITMGHLDGVQLAGGLALARSFTGAQLAPVNITRKGKGLQLGVFNYADELDGAQLGLIGIVRKGITELDVWGETSATMNVMLRHGTRWFYNLYGLATKAPGDQSVQMYGLGIGTRVWRGPVDVDLSAMTWTGGGPGLDSDLTLLNQARLTTGIGLGRRFALVAGAALNVFVGGNLEDADALNPILDSTYADETGDTSVRVWPSFFAGLRVR